MSSILFSISSPSHNRQGQSIFFPMLGHAVKHTFLQKFATSLLKVTASHEEQQSPFMIFVVFQI